MGSLGARVGTSYEHVTTKFYIISVWHFLSANSYIIIVIIIIHHHQTTTATRRQFLIMRRGLFLVLLLHAHDTASLDPENAGAKAVTEPRPARARRVSDSGAAGAAAAAAPQGRAAPPSAETPTLPPIRVSATAEVNAACRARGRQPDGFMLHSCAQNVLTFRLRHRVRFPAAVPRRGAVVAHDDGGRAAHCLRRRVPLSHVAPLRERRRRRR